MDKDAGGAEKTVIIIAPKAPHVSQGERKAVEADIIPNNSLEGQQEGEGEQQQGDQQDQQEQPQDSPQDSPEQQDEQQQAPPLEEEPMSKEDAERLLDAMLEEEEEFQEQRARQELPQGSNVEKDW